MSVPHASRSARCALRIALASTISGWVVLALTSNNVPVLDRFVWQALSVAAALATIWLVATMSYWALQFWVGIVVGSGMLRSWAYITAGAWSPFGVWLIVSTLCAAIAVAVVLIKELGAGDGSRDCAV